MMYKPPDFEYIKFGKVTLDDGTRTYQTPDGNLPSVTTILGSTGDKTFLEAWRKRIGDAQADKESKQATGLGSLMHLHLENYIMGIPRPSGSNMVRKMAEHMADEIINRGLVNVQQIWAIEQPLWFPGLYAGTADLVMIHNQTLCIGDYKTTKKPKKDEWVEDYKIQLVMYGKAHNEVYGTNIKKGVIFMASRETKYQEWVVDGIEWENMWDKALVRLDHFYRNNSIK